MDFIVARGRPALRAAKRPPASIAGTPPAFNSEASKQCRTRRRCEAVVLLRPFPTSRLTPSLGVGHLCPCLSGGAEGWQARTTEGQQQQQQNTHGQLVMTIGEP